MEITNEGVEWFEKKIREMNRMPIICGSFLLILLVIISSVIDKDLNYIGFYFIGYIIGIITGGKLMIIMVNREIQRKENVNGQ